jgi:hypothetical protein
VTKGSEGIPPDLEVAPGVSFGDWLLAEMSANVHFEEEAWALERADRIVRRLAPHRREGQGGRPLRVLIPWLRAPIAFTLPGPYIFFSRRLYERCPDDETTAFVIAHETAHHDLGHITRVPSWMPRLVERRGGALAVATVRAIERRLYGPERECEADEYALALCMAAGYAPHKCLWFFQIIESLALDARDYSMVYGPDPDSDAELAPEAPKLTRARIWAWQRMRGYLPIQDRRARLERWLEGRTGLKATA